ncbi:hypothetical protein BGZ94_007807 [Podila epigama]|nr:hypothetical protein BGZ94_007807 [Podila epigama]
MNDPLSPTLPKGEHEHTIQPYATAITGDDDNNDNNNSKEIDDMTESVHDGSQPLLTQDQRSFDTAHGVEMSTSFSGSRASSSSARTTLFVSKPLGLISGLRRVFRRNPTTVLNGRYIISLRQVLALFSFVAVVGVLCSVTDGELTSRSANAWTQEFLKSQHHDPENSSSTSAQQQEDEAYFHEAAAIHAQERLGYLPQKYSLTPTHLNNIRKRHERIRGKGTRTSLMAIQARYQRETREDRLIRERRLKAVRDGFEHAWQGYRRYAWGHDEVRPVSGGYKDTFNGWGATIIDSLDTLLIMDFHREFDEALEWIRTSFVMTKNPDHTLPFFETGIRYLGGLLSAYDLSGEKILLEKAKELGTYLLNAFQDTKMPQGRVAIRPKINMWPQRFYILAEVGTIQLEFTRLSQLTGDKVYETKAREVVHILETAKTQIPGLYPSQVTESEGFEYHSYHASVAGQIDSFYEYLLKEWILLDGKDDHLRQMFVAAMDSVHKYIVSRPESGSDKFAILGSVYSQTMEVQPTMDHLACFLGGSLAMGSKYFNRPQDLVLARQVTEACYLSYHYSTTGLGPESFEFPSTAANGSTFRVDPMTFYARRSRDSHYILRPEAVESLWVLYRITGEKKYQDKAWEMFQSLERSCRTKIAYSGLKNVNTIGSYDDGMESFFMAETMKYFYLIFSPTDVISLDQFVLNTEAHPVRRT